jgi:cytochrome c-type biogenesis protein CcmE
MKSTKIIIIAVGAFVAVAAAVIAIYVFRNEIAYFFADIKEKIEQKLLKRGGGTEFAEFVDD